MRILQYTIVVSLALLLTSESGHTAAVTIPWSTTFLDCDQDTTYKKDDYACASKETIRLNVNTGRNGPVCNEIGYQQISVAANHPGGGGGRGWRRYVCGGKGSSGSMTIRFSPQSELWARFYLRRQAGVSWSKLTQEKLFFLRFEADQGRGQSVGVLEGWDSCLMWATHGYGTDMRRKGNNNVLCNSSGAGWDTMYARGATDPATGHKIADGSWHAMELHVKMESAAGMFDGEFDMWLDGVRVGHSTAVNYSGHLGHSRGWNSLTLTANLWTLSNGGYEDYDDIAISSTGYIGLLNSSSRHEE